MQTNFLYPFRIVLGGYDLAWIWALLVHMLTLLVSIIFLPDWLALGIILFGLVSLRGIWDRQAIVRESSVLFAKGTQDWVFETAYGGKDQVCIKSASLFFGYVIFEFSRFGSTCYVVENQSDMSHEQAHKLRLLCLSYTGL